MSAPEQGRVTLQMLTPEWNAEHLIEQYWITSDALREALHRIGRNDRPWLLAAVDAEAMFDEDVLAWAVPDVWCGVEYPLAALHPGTWRDWFERAGFTVEGVPAQRPAEPLTLYRGADHAHRAGWSWTDDPDLACWFAQRPHHPTPGRVWTATVRPEHLLARIAEQRAGESEWVLDPAGLENVIAWDGTP